MPGTKHVEAIIGSRNPTAGRMTRTGGDAAGKNAQTQINARQPVITSVHVPRPTLTALDRRMRADGSAALFQSPVTQAQVVVPNAANFKRQPRTKILKYNTQSNLAIRGRRKFIEPLGNFLPHPPSRQKIFQDWFSFPYGRDGQLPSQP